MTTHKINATIRFGLFAACTAVVAAGCGGGVTHPQASGTGLAAAAKVSGSGATTSTAVTAGPHAAATGSTSAPGARPGGSTATTRSVVVMPAWFTVTADKPCTHPQDTQAFTVRGGVPGQLLIYDTEYANGTSDYTNHYGTGSGNGKFDKQGTYHTSYILSPAVPAGTAYLSVASAYGSQIIQTRTTFTIKPPTQACP